MQLVTVSRYLNPMDAQLVRSRLEAAGFYVVVTNELAALSFEGYALGVGGILVQVPEDQVEDVKDFLSGKVDDSNEPEKE